MASGRNRQTGRRSGTAGRQTGRSRQGDVQQRSRRQSQSRRQSSTRQPDNIRKIRKPLNINIGMLIFAVILIYVVACVVMSFQTKSIAPYEVKEGSLAQNYTYRGIALREETVVYTDKSGYVNYYMREGSRAAVGDLIYTVDETGLLHDTLESAEYDNTVLSDKELAVMRSEIVDFMSGFDPKNFSDTYDFKYSMKNVVLKMANDMLIENLSSTSAGNLGEQVAFQYAQDTGIVTFWTDGMEDYTSEMLTAESFEEEKYEKKQFLSNVLVTAEEPVYKLSTNENWKILIPVEAAFGSELLEEEYVKVRFLKNQYESWGKVALVTGSDGTLFAELSFTNSMVTFAAERFIDIEVILNDEEGLKIPNSSIVTREFYLIPEEYMTQSGEEDTLGVIRESYREDGTVYSEFVETSVYSYDETNKEYYLDITALDAGDNLIKPDSQERYTVSKKASLVGVYNMNKGYADFRQIIILYQNEEYAIVQSNTRYGLNVYDHIVLDASAVSDEEFIYQD